MERYSHNYKNNYHSRPNITERLHFNDSYSNWEEFNSHARNKY